MLDREYEPLRELQRKRWVRLLCVAALFFALVFFDQFGHKKVRDDVVLR
jgi:hypothetical protein